MKMMDKINKFPGLSINSTPRTTSVNFIGSWTNCEAAAPSDGREQLRTGERAGQDDMKCTVSSTSLVAVPSDTTVAQSLHVPLGD